jgi:hypothetical protein
MRRINLSDDPLMPTHGPSLFFLSLSRARSVVRIDQGWDVFMED